MVWRRAGGCNLGCVVYIDSFLRVGFVVGIWDFIKVVFLRFSWGSAFSMGGLGVGIGKFSSVEVRGLL